MNTNKMSKTNNEFNPEHFQKMCYTDNVNKLMDCLHNGTEMSDEELTPIKHVAYFCILEGLDKEIGTFEGLIPNGLDRNYNNCVMFNTDRFDVQCDVPKKLWYSVYTGKYGNPHIQLNIMDCNNITYSQYLMKDKFSSKINFINVDSDCYNSIFFDKRLEDVSMVSDMMTFNELETVKNNKLFPNSVVTFSEGERFEEEKRTYEKLGYEICVLKFENISKQN